jgi:hypothetical protein
LGFLLRFCFYGSCSLESLRAFPELLRTGYCLSAVVTNSFHAISLSDSYRTGPAAFCVLTGIGFGTVIAGSLSAFSCPIDIGLVRSYPALSVPPFTFSCDQVSNGSCSRKQNQESCGIFRTGHCLSTIVANSFPTVSLSDSYRTGPTAFHCPAGICFVFIIADDFSTFSCPI